jgi:predicted xylose isomerase-like sugar epimerase
MSNSTEINFELLREQMIEAMVLLDRARDLMAETLSVCEVNQDYIDETGEQLGGMIDTMDRIVGLSPDYFG